MTEITKINQPQPNKPAETTATAPEPTPNPCQGYQADPLTKLHLCQTCPYHQHRNETRPWLKTDGKTA